MDEAIYQGVFEKTFKNSVAARESGYCPFTYSMFESHFVTPSLIPSGKGIFLSSFQKNSAHLTHIWKPFCQPIRRGFLLQFLTATFATEKRHDFWKNFSFNPIPQLSKPKNDIFSETFSKNVLTPLPHVFGQKTDTLFQKSFPKSVPQVFLSKSQHPSRKSIKNSACLVFRSRRYIFSGIQL